MVVRGAKGNLWRTALENPGRGAYPETMRRFLCLLFLLGVATPALAQTPGARMRDEQADRVRVIDRAITRTSKTLALSVHYPVTGRAVLDRLFADYARARITEVGAPPPGQSHGVPYALNLSYKITRNDARYFAVLFSAENYTGGAHGSHFQESFVFLMPGERRVFLPELVDGARGLEKISRLARDSLRARLLRGPNALSDANWIAQGTAPGYLATTPFDWTPDALILHFGEYAVAPYVAGRQDVRIPLAALADVIRPDPAAPAPSFACAKAGKAIEKALCADARLARWDWQVAWAYARKRDAASDDKTRAALLAQQRAFLRARDASCGGGNAVCLTKAYQRRLAALEPSTP